MAQRVYKVTERSKGCTGRSSSRNRLIWPWCMDRNQYSPHRWTTMSSRSCVAESSEFAEPSAALERGSSFRNASPMSENRRPSCSRLLNMWPGMSCRDQYRSRTMLWTWIHVACRMWCIMSLSYIYQAPVLLF